MLADDAVLRRFVFIIGFERGRSIRKLQIVYFRQREFRRNGRGASLIFFVAV